MRKGKKFFNSKWERVMAGILLALTVVIAVIGVCQFNNRALVDGDFDASDIGLNEDDVGYQEDLVPDEARNEIKKLSQEEFILDKENKSISFNTNEYAFGSVCISESPDGPTADDKWYAVDSDVKSVSLEEEFEDTVEKVYVYYLAGVASSMSSYDSSATSYMISSEAELQTFRTYVNNGTSFSGKTIYLTKTINLTETSFTPIGSPSTPFAGTFDGNGFDINNLNINLTSDYVGLFGYSTGTIKNVVVNGTQITGGSYTGAIVGYNSGVITNCTNNIPVKGYMNVGGIVGEANGEVSFCRNTGAITTSITATNLNNNMGGIVGYINATSTVYNCKNNGTVTGYGQGVGGIIGRITDAAASSVVQYCTNYAYCTTYCQGYLGGIVGYAKGISKSNYTYIKNCRNEGHIDLPAGYEKNNQVGGIVGGSDGGYLYIEYCVNIGEVTAVYTSSAGILGVSYEYSYVYCCVNRGPITATERGHVGGIVGYFANGGYTYGCANTATIKGNTKKVAGESGVYQGTGGIIGLAIGGVTAEQCISIGNITGWRYTAGIVGAFSSGKATLIDCISYGTISDNSTNPASIATFTEYGTSFPTSEMTLTRIYPGASCKRLDTGDTTKKVYVYNKGAKYTSLNNGIVTSVDSVNGFSNKTGYSLVGSEKPNNWQIAPTLIQNPFDVVRPVNTTATLETICIGPYETFSYQWYKASSETAVGQAISGGSLTNFTGGATISLDVAVESTSAYYYCTVTGINSDNTVAYATTDRALVGPSQSFDKTPPTIGGHSDVQYVSASRQTVRVSLYNVTDDLSGVSHVNWYLYKDGVLQWSDQPGGSEGTTYYKDITLSGAGDYAIHGIVYDKAGNSYNWWQEHAMYIYAIPDITLTLDPNGGSVSVPSVTLRYGISDYYEMSWNKPTRPGYEFSGWYTAASGGTQIYNEYGYVVNDGNYWSGNVSLKTSSYTLYAQWVPNGGTSYTVNHYLMNLDGTNYTLSNTDNFTGTTGASVTPSVRTYTGFTAPATQTVAIAGDGSTIVNYYYSRNKYVLDLNGCLDGAVGGNITNYGTASVYVNGSAVATGITDFYQEIYYGSTYEIRDIMPTPGHTYMGVHSGSLTGTIGTSQVNVDLNFITNVGITSNPSDAVAKAGNSASFSVTASGYNPSYQWYKVTSQDRPNYVSGFTMTEKSEAAGKYYNFAFYKSSGTDSTWYSIIYPHYDFQVGNTYKVHAKIRLNGVSNAALEMRHAALQNDWGTVGRAYEDISVDKVGQWVDYEITRTFSNSTVVQGSTTYTTAPLLEFYTGDLALTDGVTSRAMDIDIKDVWVEEVTTGKIVYNVTTNGIAGNAISGATSATYTTTATNDMNNTYYYCVVSNGAGSVMSNPASLTVYSGPTAPKINATVSSGNWTNNLNIAASSSTSQSPIYYYEYSMDNGLTWNRVAKGGSVSGTTGKNIAINTYTATTNGGLTLTFDEATGIYTVNGTSTGASNKIGIIGQTFTTGEVFAITTIPVSGSVSGVSVVAVDVASSIYGTEVSTRNYIDVGLTNSTNTGSLTISSVGASEGKALSYWIYTPAGTTFTNYRFKLQIEKGSTSTAYELPSTKITSSGTIQVRAVNAQGQVSPVSTYTANIDSVKPTGSATIPYYTNTGSVTVTATASDTGSGMQCVKFPTWSEATDSTGNAQDDIVWYEATSSNSTYTKSIDLTKHAPGTEGEYHIHVYAYDNAGNNVQIGGNKVIYDKTGPTIAASNIAHSLNASITLSDSVSGISYWGVTTNTTAPTSTGTSNATTGNTLNYWYPIANTTSATSVTFTGLNPGTYYAWGKDVAGNVSYTQFTINAANYSVGNAYFTTLADACNYISTSGTIKVENSNTDNAVVYIGQSKNITLDLNGKTITVNGISSRAFIGNSGTLEVKDTVGNGAINRTYTGANESLAIFDNNGTLNIVSGTYSLNSNTKWPSTIVSSGTLNIKGGTIINTSNASWCAGIHTAGGSVNVTGGTINSIGMNTATFGIIHQGGGSASAINMSGGTINSTKQGIVIDNHIGENAADGTTLNISGTAQITGDIDAVLNNFSTGTIKVTGGTLIGKSNVGIYDNKGVLTIGTTGDGVSTTSPVIQGENYGVQASSFKFYDGILKGVTAGHTGTVNQETGYGINKGTETKDGKTYNTEKLVKANYSVDGNYFETLYDAALSIDSTGTIKVEADNEDSTLFPIYSTRNITLDTNGKTITKVENEISCSGILTITGNGTITTKANSTNKIPYLIDTNGTVIIDGVTLINTGLNEIYWYTIHASGGTVTVKNGSVKATYASDLTTEIYNPRSIYVGGGTQLNVIGGEVVSEAFGIHSWNDSGVINVSGGTVKGVYQAINVSGTPITTSINITGGTVIATGGQAILNDGTGATVIGTQGGGVNTDSPVIQGADYAVQSTNGFKFYDGILKGAMDAYAATMTPESGYGINKGTETIGGTPYHTAKLVVANYSVGDSYYATLADAYASIKGIGGNIKVEKSNTDNTAVVIEAGDNVTIDLNGKTITINTITDGSFIHNKGTLNLVDNVGNGEMKFTSTGCINLINNEGNLNVNSGTYTLEENSSAGDSTIRNNNGIVEINGGIINRNTNYMGSEYYTFAVYTIGGKIIQNGGTINIESNGKYAYVSGIISQSETISQIEVNGGEINAYSNEEGVAYCILVESNNNGSSIKVTGTPVLTAEAKYSRTICNWATGTKDLVIEGGTLIAKGTESAVGIWNEAFDGVAKVILGNSNDAVNNTTPVIISDQYAIYDERTGVKFYDGILKGKTLACKAAILDKPSNYAVYNGTETLSDGTYQVVYLKKEITNVTLTGTSYTYTSEEIKPGVTVFWGDNTLTKGTDYTVAYTANTNVGTATVTVTGTGNYMGAITKTFEIIKANITPTVNMSGYTYGGTMGTPSINGNTGNGKVTYYYNTSDSNSSGTAWTNEINSTSLAAGTYYMYAVVGATDNYNGATTPTKAFVISPAGSVAFLITLDISTYEYDGTAKTPTATVNVGTSTLTKDADYTVSYANNTNAGTATVIISGKGNYNGSTGSIEFTISKRKITLTAGSATKPYNGTELICGEVLLTSGTLASGHTLSATTVGSQTAIGSSYNEISTYSISSGTTDVTANYEVTTEKGTLTVGASNYSVGSEYFGTLAEAYAAIKSAGGTIKVERSNADNTPVTIETGDNVVIDLNGKTITVNEITNGVFITNNGILELKDSATNGKITMNVTNPTGENYMILNNPNATLNITNGSYYLNSDKHYPSVIKNKGMANINGGYIENISNGTGEHAEFNMGIYAFSGTLNISNGTIKVISTYGQGVGIFNNGVNKTEINITGGNIYGSNTGIMFNNHFEEQAILGSTLKVSGSSEISGGIYAIENLVQSDMHIYGGTITVEANEAILIQKDGSIVIEDGTINGAIGVKGQGTVKINGGTINDYIWANENADVKINGGNINTIDKVGITLGENANLTVTGGTIKSSNADGIFSTSTGKIIIGNSSDAVINTTPVIQGAGYTINSAKAIEFYDGILKGGTETYYVDPIIPNGYGILKDTEMIGEVEYETAVLRPYLMSRDIYYTEYVADADLEPYQYRNAGEQRTYNFYALGAYRAETDKLISNRNDYTSDKITGVTIIDTLNEAPTTYEVTWDVSSAKDGSIKAWLVEVGTEQYHLYIGSDGKILAPSSSICLFAYYINATEISGLSNFDTRYVRNTNSMFFGCEKITMLDISTFDTSNLSVSVWMFAGCKSLKDLKIKNNFITSKVTSIAGMFSKCNNLATLDVSKYDTSKVTDMSYVFNGCNSLETLSVSSWNTGKVTDMSYVFNGCNSLETLSVSSWNTGNVRNMFEMFHDCNNLSILDLSSWNTQNVINMQSMFSECTSLTSLDLSSFNTQSVTDMKNMFNASSGLKSILLGSNFTKLNGKNMFAGCTSLETIIAQSSTPMELSEDTGLADLETLPTLYVQTEAIERDYELATKYDKVFNNGENVKPILELIGEENVSITSKDTYTEEGVTVAGYTNDKATNYTQYGYTLAGPVFIKDGVQLDEIPEVGNYEVVYSLTYKDGSIIPTVTKTRNVMVKGVITPVVSIDNIVYGNELPVPTVTGNTGNGEVTYYYNTTNSTENGILWSSIQSSKDLPLGTYYIYAVVAATEDYVGATSEPVAFEVIKGNLNLENAVIVGDVIYGETLTANTSEIKDVKFNLTYQWYTNNEKSITGGTAIPGANSNYYTIGRDLIGKYIYVEINITHPYYNDTTITLITETPVEQKDMNSTEIKIILDPEYENTHRIVIVTDKGEILVEAEDYSLTYDLNDEANTTAISATGLDNYKNTKTVIFEGINDIVRDIIIKNMEMSGNVAITGTNKIGETLTATDTIVPEDAKLTYQWYVSNDGSYTTAEELIANAQIINGATSSTYTIGEGLADAYVYVVVTATAEKYNTTQFVDVTDNSNGTATIQRLQLKEVTLQNGPNFEYNGLEQEILLNDVNLELMTVEGTKAINQGSYVVIVTIKETKTYEWESGSTEPIKLTWSIGKKELIITAGSYTKEYDGKPLTHSFATTVVTGMMEFHSISVVTNGEITEVGTVPNVIESYNVTDFDGNDVTHNYMVTVVNGVLEVTAKDLSSPDLEFTLNPTEYTYDAKAKTPVVNGRNKNTNVPLVLGDDFIVEYTDNVDAGKGIATLTGKGNYKGTKTLEFTINPVEIAITSASANKVFDGSPLTINQYEITSGKLVDGHKETVTITGSRTEVGTSANTISSVTINDAEGNDVTKNYEITKVEGTLLVTVVENYSVDGVYYETLEDAYKGVKLNGITGTIKVEADNIDDSEFTVEEGFTITIDTNGKTITKTSTSLVNYGTLTIIGNGTVEVTNNHIVHNHAMFTLDGAKLKTTLNIANGIVAGIYNYESTSKVVMNSGIIEVNSTEVTTNNKYGILDFGGIIEVNGGTINMNLKGRCNNYTAGIAMYDGAGTLDISNASINVNVNCSSNISGILVRSGGKATINDGTNITVANSNGESWGVITEVATVNMNAGTINAGTHGIINAGEGIINISGTADINGGVSGVINSTNTTSNAQINITGGNITGSRFGVLNEGNGTVVIGSNDESINKTLPVIQGETYGYYASSENVTLEFNDGIFKGKETAISGVGKITTPEGYGIFRSTEGDYKTATLEKGWYIGKTEGTDDVWAFLLDDPENEGMYILNIQGTGEMRNYENYSDIHWAYYKELISKLVIEEGVTTIGDRAFWSLSQITEINLPSTITYIGAFAFEECTNVTGTITIPSSVTEINWNPFILIPTTAIVVEEGNTAFKSIDGLLVTIDGRKVITYPVGKTNTSYKVPAGVTWIDKYAFRGANLTNIELPETLEHIGETAFGGAKLIEVIIPSSVNGIEACAFNGCTSLKEVYIKSTDLTLYDLVTKNQFGNLAPNSIIYTTSKTIADKFVADVNYTDANTDIYYPPVISAHPIDVTVTTGSTAEFTVSATDGNPTGVTYKWQYRVNEAGEWTDVTSAQGVISDDGRRFTTVTTSHEMNGYEFRAVIASSAYPNEVMTLEELAGSLISNTATLTVEAKAITSEGIEAKLDSTSEVYTGKEIMPEVTITDNGKDLVSGEDYTVVYTENENVGKATVTVTGKGDYEGTLELNFMITARAITVKSASDTKKYDGKPLTNPNYDLTVGSLADGHSMIVTVTGTITNVGEAENTIESVVVLDADKNDVSANYNITTVNGTLLVTADDSVDFDITLETETFEYDGTAHTPGVTVKLGEEELKEGRDYTVIYKDNEDAGKASVVIKGINNYEGSSETVEFTITKRQIIVKAGSKSKEYDGEELTLDEYSLVSGSLANGHTMTVLVEGSIRLPGTVANKISSVTISNIDGDKTSNYGITKLDGTLEVKNANMAGSVTVKGENGVGEVLTVTTTIEPEAEKVTYNWYLSYTEGATAGGTLIGSGDSLILTEAMLGRYVYVEVIAEKTYYNNLRIVDATDADENKSASVMQGSKPILMEEEDSEIIFGNTGIAQRRADITRIVINDTKVKPSGTIVAEWDVSKETNKSVMAWIVNTGSAYELHIGGAGRIQVSNGDYLFANYTACTNIEGLNHLDTSEVTSMKNMFKDCTNVNALDISTFNTSNVENMNGMFENCSKVTKLDIKAFDTRKVTNVSEMFYGCKGIRELDLSKFSTANVTDMSYLFYGCEGLTDLDVTKFNVAKVEDMSYMFYACKGLTDVVLLTWNTSNVTNMSNMFNGCFGLTRLDVRNFNTSKVTDMSGMFEGCNKVTTISLVRFDTSKVLDMSNMFKACTNLTDIDVTEFNTASVENMSSMFEGCSNLTGLNLVSFDTDALTSSDAMFKGNSSLRSMLLGENFNKLVGANMFDECNGLNSIIAQSEDAIELGANTGLNSLNAKIFVANSELETKYQEATNYAQVFGSERVKVIMELLGENPVTVNPGDEYVDAGVKVTDVTIEQAKEYMQYGYILDVSGLPVDTSEPGEVQVVYTLKFGKVQK